MANCYYKRKDTKENYKKKKKKNDRKEIKS